MSSQESIKIERIIDAPREKVWQAWTEPELIKKWWGPEGFSAPNIKVDLRVGGMYIYCMRGPAGSQFDQEMYSAGVYKEIIPQEKLVTTDYFSDAQGNMVDPTTMGMGADVPAEMTIIVTFEDVDGGKTKLTIEYPKPQSEAAFEAMKNSGMAEGWNSSINKLEAAL